MSNPHALRMGYRMSAITADWWAGRHSATERTGPPLPHRTRAKADGFWSDDVAYGSPRWRGQPEFFTCPHYPSGASIEEAPCPHCALDADQNAYVEVFTASFVATLLWSEHVYYGDGDGDHEPADENHAADDIDDEGMAEIVEDCKGFVESNWADLTASHRSAGSAGRDFCLTRNGHGAGFWDGDWPEPQATRLTDASKAYGTLGLDVSDNGSLYVYN